MFKILEASYGDPNARKTARAQLKKKQGTSSFPSHFAKFHQYAQKSSWNDSALVN